MTASKKQEAIYSSLFHAASMGNEVVTQSLSANMSQSRLKAHKARRGSKALSLSLSCIMMCLALVMQPKSVSAEMFYLEGIGYREQAL